MADRTDDDRPALEPTRVPGAKDPGNPDAEALASGLQPGGMIPGGGPGATVGSLGTGGGSNADRQSGDSDEDNIKEPVR